MKITSIGITRVLLMTAAILIAGSSSAFACPVCFGAAETPIIDATRLGILVLLGITLAVQGAFVAFFIYLRRRAKRVAEADLDVEWSELQSGASRA
jgi:heme/copper-type cytochrome/quinol oxidase subunit 2